MKKFTRRQVGLIQFSIYITGLAIILGINYMVSGALVNTNAALVAAVLGLGFTIWNARTTFWKDRLKEGEEAEKDLF